MHCPKEPFVGGPKLKEKIIEMEAGGASVKKVHKHKRPTCMFLVSSVFLVDNPNIPGAIIKNALNCRDVDSWLSD